MYFIKEQLKTSHTPIRHGVCIRNRYPGPEGDFRRLLRGEDTGLKLDNRRKGSLTVEASLCFPVFIFAVLVMIYLFRFISAEYEVERSIFSTEREITSYGGLADVVSDLLPDTPDLFGAADAVAIGILVGDHIDSGTADMIEGGCAGLNFLGSRLFEDDRIYVECSYSLRIPFLLFGRLSIPVRHSSSYRYFNGHDVPILLEAVDGEDGDDEEDEDGEYVYITQTGKVYHVTTECRHLKITVSEVMAAGIENRRNKSGGKYYPCDKCAKGDKPAVLYITDSGDRYHYRRDCSGIKRTISKITLKEALEQGRPLCKNCPKAG